MLSQAKKQVIWNSWHRIQHSACGGVTTEKVLTVHHHGLYYHNKLPDALARSIADMISPVVRSQGYMVQNPAAFITCENRSSTPPLYQAKGTPQKSFKLYLWHILGD